MKYLILIIYFFAGSYNISAQDLETRLSISNNIECGVYAENANELIGTYHIFAIDSVTAVLDIWERECGKTEPIMRMRILHDIYLNRFQSEYYINYYEQYFNKYIYRVNTAKRITARSEYEYSKSYFDFTEIDGGFDKHTTALAIALLDKQGKESDAYLLCVLFSNDIKKFNEEAYFKCATKSPITNAIYNSQTNVYSNFRLSCGLGVWVPLGKNESYFNTSLRISLGIHLPISKSWRMDGTLAFVPFVNNESLDFNFEEGRESTKSLKAINFDLGFTRVNQLSKKYTLDTGISIGVNVLGTDIEDPNEEDVTQGITTLDLGAKIGLKRKLASGRSIALQSEIHYAPYNWSSHLESEVGEGYVSVGLAYGF